MPEREFNSYNETEGKVLPRSVRFRRNTDYHKFEIRLPAPDLMNDYRDHTAQLLYNSQWERKRQFLSDRIDDMIYCRDGSLFANYMSGHIADALNEYQKIEPDDYVLGFGKDLYKFNLKNAFLKAWDKTKDTMTDDERTEWAGRGLIVPYPNDDTLYDKPALKDSDLVSLENQKEWSDARVLIALSHEKRFDSIRTTVAARYGFTEGDMFDDDRFIGIYNLLYRKLVNTLINSVSLVSKYDDPAEHLQKNRKSEPLKSLSEIDLPPQLFASCALADLFISLARHNPDGAHGYYSFLPQGNTAMESFILLTERMGLIIRPEAEDRPILTWYFQKAINWYLDIRILSILNDEEYRDWEDTETAESNRLMYPSMRTEAPSAVDVARIIKKRNKIRTAPIPYRKFHELTGEELLTGCLYTGLLVVLKESLTDTVREKEMKKIRGGQESGKKLVFLNEKDFTKYGDDLSGRDDTIAALKRENEVLKEELRRERSRQKKGEEKSRLSKEIREQERENEKLREEVLRLQKRIDSLTKAPAIKEEKKEEPEKEPLCVDTEGRYVFICGHETMGKKILERFPNSRLSKTYKISKLNKGSIDAVVAVTNETGHPEYYRMKSKCRNWGIPFVNSNAINIDRLADDIAAAGFVKIPEEEEGGRGVTSERNPYKRRKIEEEPFDQAKHQVDVVAAYFMKTGRDPKEASKLPARRLEQEYRKAVEFFI